MRAHPFLLLFIFFIIYGCSSQANSLTHEDVTSIQIEGCGLDIFAERVSACEEKLTIEEKQDISIFLDAINNGTVLDGPLTAAGPTYVFTLIQENEESVQYEIFVSGNTGSFEKATQDDIRYLLPEGEIQKVVEVINKELKAKENLNP